MPPPPGRRPIILALCVVLAYTYLRSDASTELRHASVPSASSRRASSKFASRTYSDSPWTRVVPWAYVRGSVHTVIHYLARKVRDVHVEYRREEFKLKDGGTIGLDWAVRNDEKVKKPTVVIHHGLCGDAESVYVKHLVGKLCDKYNVVVLIARGCGGLKLSTPEGFTAARTEDMREAVLYVKMKPFVGKVYGVGFSLGAGILLKYLGEDGDASPLDGAVAISPAFDFACVPPQFDAWSRYRLVGGLIGWAKKHEEWLSVHPKVDWAGLLGSKTVREFDHYGVVGPYKYRDVDHYYYDASPIRVSKNITVPTLALVALDDPVCSGLGAPEHENENIGPGLNVLVTARGGHVAFAEGLWPGDSYMDRCVLDWLAAVEE